MAEKQHNYSGEGATHVMQRTRYSGIFLNSDVTPCHSSEEEGTSVRGVRGGVAESLGYMMRFVIGSQSLTRGNIWSGCGPTRRDHRGVERGDGYRR